MDPEFEKPRVTEIQVRIDCNGCVQKIKKALHGINGIYDLHIDLPQQKLTIIGWADPERIVKAIRKTRKVFTVRCLTEPTEQPSQGEAPPLEEGEPTSPPPDAANNPPTPPAELPKDPPKENLSSPENTSPTENPSPPENPPPENPTSPPPPEDPPQEVKPSAIATDTNANAKDIGEVQARHLHPPDYSYRYCYGQDNVYGYPNGLVYQHEAQQPPVHVSHGYNAYKPSPYVTEYARSPPRYTTRNNRMDHYSDYIQNNNGHQYINSYGNANENRNGNITSMFSDENPNACRVM